MNKEKPVRCVRGARERSVQIIAKRKTAAMASTQYGVQFEALMAEVCRDFGVRLVRSWDRDASKEEVKELVAEAVVAFFKLSEAEPEPEAEEVVEPEPEPEPVKKGKKKTTKKATKAVDVTVEVEEPKAKKGKGKKKVEEPEPEPEEAEPEPEAKKTTKGKKVSKSPVTEEEFGPKIAKAAKATKGKAGAKPKCQAVTAKGTQCSKCAVEGGPFCSVHLKKASVVTEEEEVEKPKAKGKAVAKKAAPKKDAKASPPKHTHSLTSPPLKENPCELCETHGMPFEVPEYEEDKPDEIEEEVEKEYDPDFVLGEDEFEEDSDEDEADEGEYDFEDLD